MTVASPARPQRPGRRRTGPVAGRAARPVPHGPGRGVRRGVDRRAQGGVRRARAPRRGLRVGGHGHGLARRDRPLRRAAGLCAGPPARSARLDPRGARPAAPGGAAAHERDRVDQRPRARDPGRALLRRAPLRDDDRHRPRPDLRVGAVPRRHRPGGLLLAGRVGARARRQPGAPRPWPGSGASRSRSPRPGSGPACSSPGSGPSASTARPSSSPTTRTRCRSSPTCSSRARASRPPGRRP